jgi:hypothetical protein
VPSEKKSKLFKRMSSQHRVSAKAVAVAEEGRDGRRALFESHRVLHRREILSQKRLIKFQASEDSEGKDCDELMQEAAEPDSAPAPASATSTWLTDLVSRVSAGKYRVRHPAVQRVMRLVATRGRELLQAGFAEHVGRLLSRRGAESQGEDAVAATWCISHLCAVVEDEPLLARVLAIAPRFVLLMEHPALLLRLYATSVVGNLAGGSAATRLALRAMGSLGPLAQLVGEANPRMARMAAWALFNLSRGPGGAELFVATGAAAACLGAAALSSDPEIVENACWVASSLAAEDPLGMVPLGVVAAVARHAASQSPLPVIRVLTSVINAGAAQAVHDMLRADPGWLLAAARAWLGPLASRAVVAEGASLIAQLLAFLPAGEGDREQISVLAKERAEREAGSGSGLGDEEGEAIGLILALLL